MPDRLHRQIDEVRQQAQVDKTVVVDSQTKEEFRIPCDAFMLVLAAVGGGDPDPAIQAILPTEDDPHKLERLYDASTGEPFWLRNMTHTGKTAANAEEG